MSETIQERESKIIAQFDEIVDSLNCMGIDDEEIAGDIAKLIYNKHRTLQQSFFRVIYCILKEYSQIRAFSNNSTPNHSSL